MSQHVQAKVKNVENCLKEIGLNISKIYETPIRISHRPEIDVPVELGPVDATYYHSLVGIMRWMADTGIIEMFL